MVAHIRKGGRLGKLITTGKDYFAEEIGGKVRIGPLKGASDLLKNHNEGEKRKKVNKVRENPD